MGIREIKLGRKSPLVERAAAGLLEAAHGAPERAGREGDQPLPEVGQGDIIGELVAKLEERKATGVKRYGRALQAFNGRDAYRDAEEELLDQYVYLTQVRREHQAVVEALLVLARQLRCGGKYPTKAEFAAALDLAGKLEASR